MPRTRSLAWSELKIGLLTILALVLAAALVFALSGSGGFSWQRYPLKTIFRQHCRPEEGRRVRIAGVPVGAVTGVDFVGDKVEVTLRAEQGACAARHDRSRAALGSVSLLGESAVDITPASNGTPIPDWGYVPAGPAPGSICRRDGVGPDRDSGADQRRSCRTSGREGARIGQLATNDKLHSGSDTLLVVGDRRHPDDQRRARHRGTADERPGGGEVARGVAGESRDGDRADQERGRVAGQVHERRFLPQSPGLDHDKRRYIDRENQRRRGDARADW